MSNPDAPPTFRGVFAVGNPGIEFDPHWLRWLIQLQKRLADLQAAFDALRLTSPSAIALGLSGQNAEFIVGDDNVLLTSGTVRYGYLALKTGDVVERVHCWVDAAAATVTTIKGGLYSYTGTTGTLLGASGNTTTAFDVLGLATLTLSTPYTVTADGHYLVAFICVATTPATLLLVGSGFLGSAAGRGGSSIIVSGEEAAQTDLDASSTITTGDTSIWVGWS